MTPPCRFGYGVPQLADLFVHYPADQIQFLQNISIMKGRRPTRSESEAITAPVTCRTGTLCTFNNHLQFNHDIRMNVLHAAVRHNDVFLCRCPGNPCWGRNWRGS